MTSKREWKSRALAAEASQVKFIDGYRVATPLLSRDASGRVTVDWDGKGDVVLMTIELIMQYVDTHNERIDAIAERDRARDCAVALEADVARLRDSLRVVHRMLGNLLDHDTEIRDEPLAEWERELLRADLEPWPNVGGAS